MDLWRQRINSLRMVYYYIRSNDMAVKSDIGLSANKVPCLTHI